MQKQWQFSYLAFISSVVERYTMTRNTFQCGNLVKMRDEHFITSF